MALCCATTVAEAMAAGLERVLLAWHDESARFDTHRHVAAAQRRSTILLGTRMHGRSVFTQKCSQNLRPLMRPVDLKNRSPTRWQLLG